MLRSNTLGELLCLAAATAPDAPALRYGSELLTYGDWDECADQCAAVMLHHGIKPGDVVALWLPSTPLYHVAYLAAARIGAVTAGINVRYRKQEVRNLLRQSGAKLLLAVDQAYGSDFRAVVAALLPELPELDATLWVSETELRSSTRATVATLGSGLEMVPFPDVGRDDPVAIVFTSGTTGVPKGAWYTHRNVMALSEIESLRYADGVVPFKKHLAAGLSFAHMGTMLRIAIQIGHQGLSIIHDSFDPARVLAEIESEQLVHLGAIPTQMIMLLDHPDRVRRDLSSLRSVLLGGAASSPALIRRIAATLGATISVRYSSTEVGIATASLPDDPIERLLTTVGKPTPGVELRIVDAENRPLPIGNVGEVVVRSPATMRGYWRAPEPTARAIDSEGWVHTGDVGCLDAEGYLQIKGRQSEMYIRGGYNVHPEEVELRLAKHPQVARVAVLGVPDERMGEIGWAFVVARDRDDPPDLTSLREFVVAEMATFKRPEGMTLVDELPLTPMFKVDRGALRKLLSQTG